MPDIPILSNVYEGVPQIDRSRIPADQMPAFLHIVQLLAELNLYERNLLLAVFFMNIVKQQDGNLETILREWNGRFGQLADGS